MAEATDPSTNLTLHEAAEALGVHYMTAYRYVRTGRLEAEQRNGTWQVSPAALEAFAAAPTVPARRPQRERTRDRLIECLTRGDEPGAWKAIEEVLAGGASASDVIKEVLVPVMRTIGDQWETGLISVADEHIASAVMNRLVARLGPLHARRGRSRGTIVVGAAPGDHHALPSLFLADLLRAEGFTVLDLGANTPTESFAAAAQSADRLISVAVGVTATGLDDYVVETTAAVRGAVAHAPVFVGGSAISGSAHARRLGSDGWAATLDDAVALLSGNGDKRAG